MFEVQGGENLPRLLDLISFSTQEVGGGYDDDEADDDHRDQDGGVAIMIIIIILKEIDFN